jgi:glyoxylase-like metal-dependent hydrolase (beta-lactamase superfamily II)
MAKAFASQADMTDKKITFSRLSEHAYAFTAEGDPNTGIVIGDDAVMVIDAQATPRMAEQVIERIRTVTDKPIKYVVLTHYHAVRVLGASGYSPEHIICSEATREMIVERGAQDYKSELQRFPRLFQAAETIPGLTWPTITFTDRMTLWLGKLQVDIIHAGRGHTKGDTIVWLPEERTLFSGDLVEYGATPYCGDAHYKDWPETLQKLRDLKAEALVPGRGDALIGEGPVEVQGAGQDTRAFIADLSRQVSVEAGAKCRQGPETDRLQGDLRQALQAQVRPLGHLRPLHAVRRHPLLRRADAAYDRSAHLDGRAGCRDVGRRWKRPSDAAFGGARR